MLHPHLRSRRRPRRSVDRATSQVAADVLVTLAHLDARATGGAQRDAVTARSNGHAREHLSRSVLVGHVKEFQSRGVWVGGG